MSSRDVDPISESYDRVRHDYCAAIGRSRADLVTPALVLDLPAAKRNITKMGRRIRVLSAEIRPHIKVHRYDAFHVVEDDVVTDIWPVTREGPATTV